MNLTLFIIWQPFYQPEQNIRTIQHMMQTSFWSPDGKPMSATEFIEQLFGDLPDLFKNKDELRELWSAPDTRRKLLEGRGEKGYGKPQLSALARWLTQRTATATSSWITQRHTYPSRFIPVWGVACSFGKTCSETREKP